MSFMLPRTWTNQIQSWRIPGEGGQSAAYELLSHDGHLDRARDEDEGMGASSPGVSFQDLPGPRPTAAQIKHLRRVAGSVPKAAYAMAFVELAERASYYGVGGLFPNFVQRPLPPGGPGTGAPPPGSQITPGALGMGLQVSTALSVIFSLSAYTTPLLGGLLADLRWGKFKTIAVGTAAAGVAHALSVYSALPYLLQNGGAFPPFLLGLLLLGASAGLIKANIAPIMAEQYTPAEDWVRTEKDGEKVIVGREVTIQKIMSAYYGSINVGAFLAIISTFAEKYVGFWLAFLIPGVIFLLIPILLYFLHPHLATSLPPSSSALLDAYRHFRHSFSPTPRLQVPAEEAEEMTKAGTACRFFAFFVVYNIADGGLNALVTSLAGSMTTNGVPNDFLGHANPLIIVLAIPLLNHYFYPFLATRRIPFGPVRRVTVGFVLAAAGMAWSAIIQHAVYTTSPCGKYATTCEEGTGVSPLSAWLILPAPLLAGLSESLSMVAAMEIGYMMSPPSLRSIINSLFLFTQAISSGLVLVILPLMRDPLLVWPFGITTVMTLLAAWGLWRSFAHLDADPHF